MTGLTTIVVSVPGMSCGHCETAVKREVGEVAGVERVDVDLDSKDVVVTGSDLELTAIVDAIGEAGYDVA